MSKKSSVFLFVFSVSIIVVAIWILNSSATSNRPDKTMALDDLSSELRIENEDKLVIPPEKTEAVWNYLLGRLIKDKQFIKNLDSGLNSYWYDELFMDVYFDTPDLLMLRHQSGIRYRKRVNLTNPDHRKSGRELVQIKLSDVDESALNRGELKYTVEHPTNINTQDDIHPVLGIITPSERPRFKQVMSDLGINPYSLREVLVNEQRRRSIYITRYGEQFISIRLDECSSSLLWTDWRHVELEPELNELPYTQADSTEKAFMESINSRIVDDILEKFPEIERDLTPKYNKAFKHFDEKIPLLRFMIRH
nr:hypothetical protein [candidate division KSB1 bacterium]NIR71918.1 hypothetical protein [candidate division KSB1 bacterium]NIS23628.1 hypothetical protein [candidate division KSB1 bacterium]NIT70552.1 hypothetical protein [candidate division KSB1 bacterium]NIU24469.1 hypothetical protein [candidate division KSB1 bacterium]